MALKRLVVTLNSPETVFMEKTQSEGRRLMAAAAASQTTELPPNIYKFQRKLTSPSLPRFPISPGGVVFEAA